MGDYVSKYTGAQIDKSVSSGSSVSGRIQDVNIISGSIISTGSLGQLVIKDTIVSDGNISSSGQLYGNILNVKTRVNALNTSLEFSGNNLDFVDGDSLTYLMRASSDSSASLYYSGNKKLATVATGIDVTGNITASGHISASGTTTTEDLIVKDNATIAGNLDIADTIYHTGDSNTKIRFPSTDTISFHTSGDEQMRIDASGHITASGNISSSGTIVGSKWDGDLTVTGDISASGNFLKGTRPAVHSNETGSFAIDTRISGSFTSLSSSIDSTRALKSGISGSFKGATDLTGSFGRIAIGSTSAPSHLTVEGSISASGNISAAAAYFGGDVEIGNGSDILLDEDQRIYFEADKQSWVEADSTDRLRVVVGGSQMMVWDQDDGRAVFGNGTKVYIGANNNAQPDKELVVDGDISGSKTSTGSFGRVEADSFNLETGTFSATDDVTTAGNIISTGASKFISGSSTGTGSFASLVLVDKVQGDLTATGQITADNISGSGTGSFDYLSIGRHVKGDINFGGYRQFGPDRIFNTTASFYSAISASGPGTIYARNIVEEGKSGILVKSPSGDVELNAGDDVILEATDDIKINADDNIQLVALDGVEIDADNDIRLDFAQDGDGDFRVRYNTKDMMDIENSSSIWFNCDISSSGTYYGDGSQLTGISISGSTFREESTYLSASKDLRIKGSISGTSDLFIESGTGSFAAIEFTDFISGSSSTTASFGELKVGSNRIYGSGGWPDYGGFLRITLGSVTQFNGGISSSGALSVEQGISSSGEFTANGTKRLQLGNISKFVGAVSSSALYITPTGLPWSTQRFISASNGNIDMTGDLLIGGTISGSVISCSGGIYSDDKFTLQMNVPGYVPDTLIKMYNSSDDGVIDVYQNNSVKNRIHGNGTSYFTGGDVVIGTTVAPYDGQTFGVSGSVSASGDLWLSGNISASGASNKLNVVTGSHLLVKGNATGNAKLQVGFNNHQTTASLEVSSSHSSVIFKNLPSSSVGLESGSLYTQTAVALGLSGSGVGSPSDGQKFVLIL